MAVAQGFLQAYALLITGLDRKREQPAGREHLGDTRDNRRDVAAIDEHVGGQHQVVLRAGFACEKFQQVGDRKPVVEALGARLLDHAGRDVDADQPVAPGPERRAA